MSRAQVRPATAGRASLARRRHARQRRTIARLTAELAAAQFEATHDPLTGLLNRPGLAVAWPDLRPCGVLLVDLDGFKPVNDQYGHLAGDVVLQVIGARLASAAAVAVRLGGDEFVMVLTDDADPVECAHRLTEIIGAPISLSSGAKVRVTASIGVAPIDAPISMYAAVEHADQAMYAAKGTPGTTVVVFTPALPDVPAGERRRDVSAGARVVAQRR